MIRAVVMTTKHVEEVMFFFSKSYHSEILDEKLGPRASGSKKKLCQNNSMHGSHKKGRKATRPQLNHERDQPGRSARNKND